MCSLVCALISGVCNVLSGINYSIMCCKCFTKCIQRTVNLFYSTPNNSNEDVNKQLLQNYTNMECNGNCKSDFHSHSPKLKSRMYDNSHYVELPGIHTPRFGNNDDLESNIDTNTDMNMDIPISRQPSFIMETGKEYHQRIQNEYINRQSLTSIAPSQQIMPSNTDNYHKMVDDNKQSQHLFT
jgi:hypothetical protein